MERKTDWNKVIGICTIGLLVVGSVPVVLQVWDRIYPQGQQSTPTQGAPMTGNWGWLVLAVAVLLGVGLNLVAAFVLRGKREGKIVPAIHDECRKNVDSLELRIKAQQSDIEKEKAWSKALTAELSDVKASLAGKVQQFKDEHRKCQDLVEQKQLTDEALVQRTAEVVAIRNQIEAGVWLNKIAETEKAAIEKTVTITSAGLLRTDFSGSAPYINFNFDVHNCSVFPISLDSVEGFVKCVTAPIGKRLEVDNRQSTIVSNECPHGSTRSLVIRVWLLQDDLKLMEEHSDLYFKFDELHIKVRGGKQWSDITSKKVTIDWVMDREGNAKPWRN